MNDDGKKGWLADVSDTYGVVRLWILAILGPALAASEMLQGRVRLGLGLAFICVMIWAQLAKQLGAEGATLDRIAKVSLVIGGSLLAWHYLLWWVAYLR